MEKNINKWWETMFTKREQWLFLMFLFAIMVIYGANFNMGVIVANQGKMPVDYGYDYEEERHVLYEDVTEANDWYLGDILGIKGYFKFSFGDVLVFIGFIGIMFSLIKWRNLRLCKMKQEKV